MVHMGQLVYTYLPAASQYFLSVKIICYWKRQI